VKLIRYADDFIVVFQAEREAVQFSEALKFRKRNQNSDWNFPTRKDASLRLVAGRGRRQNWGKGRWQRLTFLGSPTTAVKHEAERFRVGHKTAGRKFRQKLKALNQWFKGIRNTVAVSEWWEILKAKVVGHYRYYGISGNMRWLMAFYYQTTQLAYKWLNRRSQRKSYTYAQFSRLVKYNPLPRPKIYHQLYTPTSY
jgi:hypothetical protein